MASVNPLEVNSAQGLQGLEASITEVDKLRAHAPDCEQCFLQLPHHDRNHRTGRRYDRSATDSRTGADHEPRKGGEYSLAASAIHIADAGINTNRVGSSGCGFELAIHPEALERIDIELEEIEQTGIRAAQQIQAVVRQFMSHERAAGLAQNQRCQPEKSDDTDDVGYRG